MTDEMLERMVKASHTVSFDMSGVRQLVSDARAAQRPGDRFTSDEGEKLVVVRAKTNTVIALAGTRSLRDTVRYENQIERAREAWGAMLAAQREPE